jgi:hypothetical protein
MKRMRSRCGVRTMSGVPSIATNKSAHSLHRQVERAFPGPNKMCGVCLFEFGVVSLGEAQKPFGTSPVAQIDGRRGDELQIMDVESENAQ